MQALIDFLIRNIMAFWPITRVNAWQMGLRVRLGRARDELGPGIHWRWPFLDQVMLWASTEITRDLPLSAVTTVDGHSVVISANVSFRMRSIRTMYLTVWDVESSLGFLTIGKLASACAQRTWPTLRDDRAALEASLLQDVAGEVSGWGIDVTRMHLTDLVLAKQYRFFGEMPTR